MGIVIDFVALILLYTFCFYKRWKATGKIALLVNTAMYIFVICVVFYADANYNLSAFYF